MNSSKSQVENIPYSWKLPISRAFHLSIPALLAYFPFGLAFGILFCQFDYPWYYAPIMSATVYSGTVQFIAMGIIATHGSISEIIFATFFVAARNIFYGLSLYKRYNVPFLKKLYLMFTLVDATYSVLATTAPLQNKKQDERFCLFFSLFIYFYWIGGTFIGAYYGSMLPDINGLDFVIPAFFAVLTIENYLKEKSIKPFLMATATFFCAKLLTPHNPLFVAITLSALILTIQNRKESVK